MCRAVKCSTCGKTTWAGCGAHVDAVLGHLPKDQVCRCREEKASTNSAEKPEKKGIFSRFGGR
ncbi:MAG: hypothetical protein U1E65_17115 [Myxococcota bacterium]